VGVGFSAEAVRQARRLGTGAADAVLCVDAIHFAAEPSVGYREIQQIPTSGGRAVLTCWEPLGQDGGGLPGRLRRVDLGARLGEGGAQLRFDRGQTWEAEREGPVFCQDLWRLAVGQEQDDAAGG
jgi:hypothetical protein